MNRGTLDVLSNPRLSVALYCVPIAVLVLSGMLKIGDRWQAIVWAICLFVMAAGCMINAVRCGRVHCYFTGPFLILMAVGSLLYGFGWLPLGISGWNWIGGVTLCGAIVLFCVPELVLGKYRA
jgi:hypothetical protein